MSELRSVPIAIVGCSALFPGSTDTSGFWRSIVEGRDLVTEVPSSHWLVEDYYNPNPGTQDKTYAKRGAFLTPVEFPALDFGIPPSVIPHTDTAQLLALLAAKRALDDAMKGTSVEIDRDRIGVILGSIGATEGFTEMSARLQRPLWADALRACAVPEEEVEEICDAIADGYAPWSESTFPGLLSNVVAGRIANRLNLGGENCTVDAACASSLAAVEMSIRALESGSADLMLTGGVDALNTIFTFMCFTKTPALSPTGDSRPFSDKADGTILGEGVGVLALKRLADAERDGNAIYAVIRGIGSSSDGRAKSVYAPHAKGQAKALRRAYEMAGYSPRTVELVEGHGTATAAGDAAEVEALRDVFEAEGKPSQAWCALGSVKSQIGHTKAAAGAAGLFKAVMALHHKVLPPTIKVERPNPDLKLDESAFYLNTEARPWIRAKGQPRRASVSSFGFGGSNYHVTLEEYQGPQRPGKLRTSAVELVLVSGASAEDVMEQSRQLQAERAAGATLVELARRTQLAWDSAQPVRLAVLAADEAELGERLEQAISHMQVEPERSVRQMNRLHYAVGREPGKVAFLFPGQGSQYVGMGADLAMTFEAARAVWDEAAEVEIEDGLRVHDVVFPQPVFSEAARQAQRERLTRTEWAQPCIAVASMAGLAVLRSLNIQPDCMAGHSFGETTSLYAAGVWEMASTIEICRGVARLAKDTAPGAMAAVFSRTDVDELSPLFEACGVSIANYNSRKQCVVTGQPAQIEQLKERLPARTRLQPIPVDVAFHSPAAEPILPPFRELLTAYPARTPMVDVYSCLTGEKYAAKTSEEVLNQYVQVAARPVLYAQQVAAMYRDGVRTFIEVGPGSVLAGITEQCLEGQEATIVSLDRNNSRGLTGLWNALAQLAVAGVPMHLASMWAEFPESESATDSASLRSSNGPRVTISGANSNRPYPTRFLDQPVEEPVPVNTAASSRESSAEASGASEDRDWAIRMQQPEPPVEPAPALRMAHGSAHEVSAPVGTLRFEPFPNLSFEEGGQTVNHPCTRVNERLLILQELQNHMTEAHISYQKTMAEVHETYLRLCDLAIRQVAATHGDIVLEPERPAYRAAAIPAPSLPAPSFPAPRFDAPSTDGLEPGVAEVAPSLEAAQPARGAETVDAPGSQAAASPPAATHVISGADETSAMVPHPSTDIAEVFLDIVAEKTGYPRDILELDMDMEGDLGIDSIKRVEILSAVQDRVPTLPEISLSELATLGTLRQVITYVQQAETTAAGVSGR
ncbi:MAG: acyltransferase domain-containing protein [Alicyclobacillus sp.]|nr:acyltransferase domain-containing protein [Alicyclobacillus sp.]